MFNKLTPYQWALFSTALITALHLLVASQAGLSTDEAHYALYGLHLDWSYFDHPPLVGWLQTLVLPFSDSDFAMRLVPATLYALTSLILYQVCAEFFPEQPKTFPLLVVLLYQSGFIFQLIGFALVPETPLLLFSLLVVWSFHRLLSQKNPKYWLLIGLFMGLAALSKYTAITLVISAVILLITERQSKWYKEPYFYLAILMALIIISPILYWNAEHDWISFNYQIDHGTGEKNWLFENWFVTHLVQFITYSPLIFISSLMGIIVSFKKRHQLPTKILLIFCLPIFLLFSWNAGYVKSLPHWTALFWLLSLPLAVIWLLKVWHLTRVKLLSYSAIAFSVSLSVCVLSQFYSPWINLPIEQNFARDLQQWNKLKPNIESIKKQLHQDNLTLFVPNWTIASRLAWYMKPEPVKVLDARYDQFDIWFQSPQAGDSGLLVFPDYFLSPAEVTQTLAKFNQCIPLQKAQQQVPFSFIIYHCIDFEAP